MTSSDESQIYRDLLRFKPAELSPNSWAVKAGVSRTVWADMRRHGNPSRRTLEKLLTAANSSLAEFEALRIGQDPKPSFTGTHVGEGRWEWAGAQVPPLPLIASRLAGEWGESGSQIELAEILPSQVIDRLQRPASLAADRDAFALTVVGDAMWPRFRPGSRIAVSPRAPVAIGDDVLVLLKLEHADHGGAQPVLIGQLVRKATACIELRQFNPALIIQVGGEEVDSIKRIQGELI